MASIFVRTNISQLTDVIINDMGVLIDIAVTDNEFSTELELETVRLSGDLLTLATDDAYGADQSTLIISATDNGTAYTSAQAAKALARAGLVIKAQNWFGDW